MYPFIIVEYDPRWPLLFDQISSRLHARLLGMAKTVEHIGSTSVPNLAGKPILDIMVGVKELTEAEKFPEYLLPLGYEYVPDYEGQLPMRRHYRMYSENGPAEHLHIVEEKTDFWERHLLFRDYLRSHSHIAKQYELLKRQLAAKYALTSAEYTEGKSSFVQRIELVAREAQTRTVG